MQIRVGVVVLVSLVLAVGPSAARADDRASVEAGRTAGRGLLIVRDPKACGIALLRQRCIADVDAFLAGRGDADFKDVPRVGPHPASALRTFVTAGGIDQLDPALAWYNTRRSTAAMWAADARNAALYDAGIEDVTLPAALGSVAREFAGSGSVLDIIDHGDQVPAGALPVTVPPKPTVLSTTPITASTSTGSLPFAHALVAALDTGMPAPPLTPTRAVNGPAGDAALGVAGSTVAQLIDSPAWLFQTDAQRFIDDWTVQLATRFPGRAAEIAALHTAIHTPVGFSHDAALQSHTALVRAIVAEDKVRAKPFVLGGFAAQLVYDAAIVRRQNLGAMMSRFLADETALDTSIPGWSAERAAASAPDWNAQYQHGLRLVDLTERANRP